MSNARELTNRLAELLRTERAAMADFLVALARFDERRLWADLGHANLFSFLHRELRLSLGAAHYRKTAAGLVQRYPEVVAPLRDGRLCLTSVVELAKVITPENREEVLPRFFHRSKLEAKAIAAELCPRAAPVRDLLTTIPRSAANEPLLASPPEDRAGAQLAGLAAVDLAPLSPPLRDPAPSSSTPFRPDERVRRPPRDEAEPLTADLRRLHLTVSRRFVDKLEAARAALSHARPGASTAELLEAGLDLVLAQHAKRRGLVAKPRKAPRPTRTDAVPAHVKREVWTRAGGRCECRLDSGEVCGSTTRLEYDHVVPRALGGPSTIDNVRLACRDHNLLAARRVFGDAWMERFRRSAPAAEAPALERGRQQLPR